MRPLKESPFSFDFNYLRNIGCWLHDAKSETELNWYIFYRYFVTTTQLVGITGLVVDLYLVLGDIKKMSWNLCITTLLIGMVFKNWEMVRQRKILYWLRLRLHQDSESRERSEHISINNLALKEMKLFRMSFYGGALVFVPAWILPRYIGFFYGARELPIPFLIPPIFGIDMGIDWQFQLAFFILGFCAITGILIIMELELSMYGLMIQISREYKIFVRDIPLVNRMYTDENEDEVDDAVNDWLSLIDVKMFLPKKEINPWLKKNKTKMLLKSFSARQMSLIQYTEAFESSLNKCFLQQFFLMSIAIIALALQCLWETVDWSGEIVYQFGYLAISVADMFMICSFSTRLRDHCLEVGETIYSTLWYRMGAELQKDIAMMILRSQHPPKITIGKFKEVDLGLFMNIMFHLYSWLALIRQLDKNA